MFGYNQPLMNPQMQIPQQVPSLAPRYEVIKVNGEAGARNFRMGQNSNALLLDETAPIIWYVQTDGTGYLTVTPFDITPHQVQAPINLNDLSERVSKLEEAIANVQQSNFSNAKQRKQQRVEPTNDATV